MPPTIDAVDPSDMPRAEAVEKLHQIRSNLEAARLLLLEMHERKGYRALGYTSFAAFGLKELGHSKRNLWRIVASTRLAVEHDLPFDLPMTLFDELLAAPPDKVAAIASTLRNACRSVRNSVVMLDGKRVTAKQVKQWVGDKEPVKERGVKRLPFVSVAPSEQEQGVLVGFRLPNIC